MVDRKLASYITHAVDPMAEPHAYQLHGRQLRGVLHLEHAERGGLELVVGEHACLQQRSRAFPTVFTVFTAQDGVSPHFPSLHDAQIHVSAAQCICNRLQSPTEDQVRSKDWACGVSFRMDGMESKKKKSGGWVSRAWLVANIEH